MGNRISLLDDGVNRTRFAVGETLFASGLSLPGRVRPWQFSLEAKSEAKARTQFLATLLHGYHSVDS